MRLRDDDLGKIDRHCECPTSAVSRYYPLHKPVGVLGEHHRGDGVVIIRSFHRDRLLVTPFEIMICSVADYQTANMPTLDARLVHEFGQVSEGLPWVEIKPLREHEEATLLVNLYPRVEGVLPLTCFVLEASANRPPMHLLLP